MSNTELKGASVPVQEGEAFTSIGDDDEKLQMPVMYVSPYGRFVFPPPVHAYSHWCFVGSSSE